MLAPYLRFLPIVTFSLVATGALGSGTEYDSDSGEIPLDDAPSVQEVKFKIAAMEPLSEADRLVYEAELLGNNPDMTPEDMDVFFQLYDRVLAELRTTKESLTNVDDFLDSLGIEYSERSKFLVRHGAILLSEQQESLYHECRHFERYSRNFRAL
jgi:hypothetical protein